MKGKPWLAKQFEVIEQTSVMKELEIFWENRRIIDVAVALGEVVYRWAIF
jgi:hypothetical protein